MNMSRVVIQLPGHSKNFNTFLTTNWIKSATASKALLNLESIYLASLEAATWQNSEGIIYRIECICRLYLQTGEPYSSMNGAPWSCAPWGSVTLLSSIPVGQTPFPEKAPSASATLDHLCLPSLAHLLISLLLEAFLGFPNPFLLFWYHCNYIC